MNRAPGVSVAILSHNYGRFVREAVRSVLAQTPGPLPLLEVLVLDDGSTDETLAEARAMAAEDARVRVIHNPAPVGAVRSANLALESVTGTHIVILDGDDRLARDYLRICSEALLATGASVAYGSIRRFGAQSGTVLAADFDPRAQRVENQVHKSALFTANLVDQGIRFDVRFEHLGQEDWAFWLDALGGGAGFVAVPDAVLEYRRHEDGSRNSLSRLTAIRIHLLLALTRRGQVTPADVVRRARLSLGRNWRDRSSGDAAAIVARGGSQGVSLLLQAAYFAAAARALGTSEFIAYVAVTAALGLAAVVSELGLPTTTALRIVEDPADSADIAAASLAASLCLGGLALVVASPIAGVAGGPAAWGMLVALGPAFLVRRLVLAYEGVAAAHQAWRSISASRALGPLLALVLLLLLAQFASPATSLGLSLLAGEVAAFAILLHGSRERMSLPKPRRALAMVKEAVPLGLVGVLSLVHNRVDQPLLGALGARDGLAAYAIAYRPLDALVSVFGAMSLVMLTWAARSPTSARPLLLARSIRGATAVGCVLALGLVVVRAPLVEALGGQQAGKAATYLLLLAPAVPLFAVISTANQFVIAAGGANRLIGLAVGCASLNIALNVALIPRLGATAAGISTLVSGGVNALGSLLLATSVTDGNDRLGDGGSAAGHVPGESPVHGRAGSVCG